jgi:hypothetical protein
MAFASLAGLAWFYFRVLAWLDEAGTTLDPANPPPVLIGAGLVVVACLLGSLVGFGLGIAGLVQKDRRRLVAVLGLALNAFIGLGVSALIVIGLRGVSV